MSRRPTRPVRTPRPLNIEALETRRMLSTVPAGLLLARTPAARRALAEPREVVPRPDLDGFAADMVHRPRMAYRMGLGALARELSRPHHEPVAARHGWGACLAMELTEHPVYAARKGLTHLLTPPAPAASPTGAEPRAHAAPTPDGASPAGPADVGTGGTASPPDVGPDITHVAPDVIHVGPDVIHVSPDLTPVGPVVTQAAFSIAVGSRLAVTLPGLGLGGPNLSYTIRPQPLPENMTFHRGTGELTFAPDPGQVGRFDFAVTISDGTRSARLDVPITVTRIPRASTEASGRVVDEAGRPMAAVPVKIGALGTRTDAAGRFLFRGVPDHPGPLMIDGAEFGDGGYLMPMAPVEQLLGHPLHANVENVVPGALTLPRLDLAHAADFGRLDRGRAHDLTSPLLPGVVLHVAPDSARTRGGGRFAGKIALTALPVEKLRPFLPPGIVPSMMVGVDGPHLRFETPAKITLPNTDGYAPGSVLDLMTMNMATGGFDVTGHLRVSADGTRLETIDGGITASTCVMAFPGGGGQGLPYTNCEGCQPLAGNMNSDAGLITGEFFEDHALVSYASQGRDRGLTLQYSSLQADPRPVVQFQPSIMDIDPDTIGAQVAIGGITQGAAVTYTPAYSPGYPDYYRVPLQVDATGLATGAYRFDMTVTHNYSGSSSFSGKYSSTANVVNAAASPMGAGWSIGGLQRLYNSSANGPALITAGSQGTERYDYRAGGPIHDVAIVTAGAGAATQMLRNDGRGGLTVPASGTTAADSPITAAAGDFNGDGKADLAVIAGTAATVLLADAAGGFAAGVTYSVATAAAALVVANFDNDAFGRLDLAVLRTDGTVVVLPGNGDGTFAAAIATTVSGGSFAIFGSMDAGDFDADGTLDLAVASTHDGQLRVLTGTGTGAFNAAVAYPLAGGASTAVAAGDLTGDGDLDLAVAGGGGLYLLVGDGAGGFTPGGFLAELEGGAGFMSVAVGDFFGDGQLAAAAYARDPGLTIVPGSPSGSWGSRIVTYESQNTFEPGNVGILGNNLTAADLNGDGRPDLAFADGGSTLMVLFSDPLSNQMLPVQRFATGSTAVVAAAPFTGRTAAPHYAGPMSDPSTLVRNGDGTWTCTYPDATVVRFNTLGQQTVVTDRNGNATTYAYATSGAAAGALTAITDPVGLVTTLTYDATSGKLASVIDPANRTTTFTIDASGNLTQIVDPDAAVTQFGYATPANHRITTEVSPRGSTATVTYDRFGRVESETLFDGTSTTRVGGADTKGLLAPRESGALPRPAGYKGTVTDPNNHTTTLSFDNMGHATSSTDADNKTTTFTRDRNGYPTAITDPLNRTTRYAYDARGNVTRVTRHDSSTMAIDYDPTFSRPTRVVDYRSLITTYTLDGEGNVTRRTDPDLGHEDYTYNAAGQVLTDTDRNGRTTTFAYDTLGRLATITYPGAGSPAVEFAYNTAGDLTAVRNELGNWTTMTYDLAGRLLSVQDPVQAAAGAGVKTVYAYDAAGNRTSATDALGRVTSYTYDARNRLAEVIDPVNQGTGRKTALAYDGMNLTSVTDPLGHATTYGYDALNRRVSVRDALNHVTTATYDAAGQLTGVTDANNHTTTLAYDALGRLRSRTRPGTAPDRWDNLVAVTTTFTYDANSNLTRTDDAMGNARRYAYDDLDRLTTTTVTPDPFGFDSIVTAYAYDAVGNRTGVIDGENHRTTYTYDERDRLVSAVRPGGGGTTAYSYDAHSRLTSLTDPVGNLTTYGYDAADRVTTVTDPRSKVTTYAYDVVGNRTQAVDRLGRIVQYGYDADDRPTTETWLPGGGGTALRTATTTYDAAGRVTAVQDPDSQYAYGYDDADRLTAVDNLGTPTLARVLLTSTYDAVGNRTGLSDSQGGVTGYAYDVRDQLTRITQSGTGVAAKRVDLAYDAAGRRTTLTRSSDLAGATTVLRSRSKISFPKCVIRSP